MQLQALFESITLVADVEHCIRNATRHRFAAVRTTDGRIGWCGVAHKGGPLYREGFVVSIEHRCG